MIACEVGQHARARATRIKQYKLDIFYLLRLNQQEISIPSHDIAGAILFYSIFEQLKPLLILLKGKNPSTVVVLSQLHSLVARCRTSINDFVLLLSPFLLYSFQEEVGRECAAEALHHAGRRLQQI